MSTTSRSTSRARILCLASQESVAAPHPCLTSTPSIFHALGEVASCTAACPVVAVLFPSSAALDPQFSAHVRALRTLDPTVQLLLLGSSTRPLSQPSSAVQPHLRGPDGVLALPVPSKILDALAAGEDILASPNPLNDPPPPATPRIDPIPQLPSSPSVSHLTQQLSPHRPAPAAPTVSSLVQSITGRPNTPVSSLITSSLPQPVPAPTVPARPSDPPSTPPPAHYAQTIASLEPTDSLGDTDLISALIADPPTLLQTALNLIIQQTRWTDLAFLPHPQPPSPAQLHAPVELAGNRFGVLVSSLAGSRQLAPWGQWLSHWLNLDRLFQLHRDWAFKDDLTGAFNRRYFNFFLDSEIPLAAQARRPITVMVFDLDNFKQFNDEFGHQAGDLILVETVKLLMSVIRQTDRVCRIGGDEFAVIFTDPQGPREAGSVHPTAVEAIASRFQQQVCHMRFPKLAAEAPGSISISAGMATFPWDGPDAATLLRRADELALQSKRGGKNAITFGPARPC